MSKSNKALKTAPKKQQSVRTTKRAVAESHISKHDQILNLLRRKDGATLDELQKTSGWQSHSVRGFLSGTVKKKLGLNLRSIIGKTGERRYAIAAG